MSKLIHSKLAVGSKLDIEVDHTILTLTKKEAAHLIAILSSELADCGPGELYTVGCRDSTNGKLTTYVSVCIKENE